MQERNLIRQTAIGFVFSTLLGTVAAEEPAELTMRVTPTVSQNGEVSLRFKLRYEGKQSFEADRGSIPSSKSLRIVSLGADRFPDYDNASTICRSLKEVITIDDPSPGYVEVKPGQEFVEDVPLSNKVEGVKDVLGRCELVVTWSYKMYTQDKVRFPRMAGSIVIPSSRVPVAPPDVTVRAAQWSYKPTP